MRTGDFQGFLDDVGFRGLKDFLQMVIERAALSRAVLFDKGVAKLLAVLGLKDEGEMEAAFDRGPQGDFLESVGVADPEGLD